MKKGEPTVTSWCMGNSDGMLGKKIFTMWMIKEKNRLCKEIVESLVFADIQNSSGKGSELHLGGSVLKIFIR